ncbi:putative chromatin-remodeling complex ATPase chain [Cucumis melo var. makuwa]|uniref:Chromatin-remodeling complex ATPase chain n=1 Tax=Cucumis melo var. makuwa TaxID=1194695 RepID=A0A5D3D5H8_CUCMM|nr:putative chromatin-remodeling complex ATPase chain [Cucumis melo var. makuwa]TYK18811.1 putative chromatin-remodeling complex ATPase chain [Cucumis melo var. makuwa]
MAVNKDELLQMVRFGAEMVCSSKDSTITDEDIDKIIVKGEATTAELDAKMKKFTEDVIKFKMDGTAELYDFDDEKVVFYSLSFSNDRFLDASQNLVNALLKVKEELIVEAAGTKRARLQDMEIIKEGPSAFHPLVLNEKKLLVLEASYDIFFIKTLNGRVWRALVAGYEPPTITVDGVSILKPEVNWTDVEE